VTIRCRHRSRGRLRTTQQANGRLRINRVKVKAEERLDGKYLIATSDPHISAEDVALGYKNLLEAERGFRDLKSDLLLRPAFHRLEHRIRAHVLICWLALLLARVAERGSRQTWRNINRQLGRISQLTLAGPAGTVTQTTPLKPEQKALYQALSIQPPARVTAFDPT
jgi:transposase